MKRINWQRLVVAIISCVFMSCNDEVEFQGVQAKPATPSLQKTSDGVAPEEQIKTAEEFLEESKSPTVSTFTEKYPVSQTSWETFQYTFENQSITRDLTLENPRAYSATFVQTDRPSQADSWVQGHDGEEIEEPFPLAVIGKLDLAIVVDDSSSMSEEHEDLASRLEILLSELEGIDWQMGISTTTSSCLRPNANAIRSTDADYASQFEMAVKPGTDGDDNERGLERAAETLRGECENKPWVRDDSLVAVLFVSDENSFCGLKCKGEETSESFIDTLRLFRPDHEELLRSYAIVWNPTDCTKNSSESDGSRYREVVSEIGGLSLPICGDFSNLLSQISVDVARSLRKTITLSHVPTDGQITVLVDGEEFEHFTLEGRELSLNQIPVNAGGLIVKYRHSPVAKRQDYELSDVANTESLMITWNGAPVPKTDYLVQGRSVSFVEMPPDHTKIKASYRVGANLNREFDLTGIGNLSSILDVHVNGQFTDAYAVSMMGTSLIFDSAPSDGAVVELSYEDGEVRLDYEMDVPRKNDVDAITARDTLTGDVFDIRYVDGVIHLTRDQFSPGRNVEVVFTYFPDTVLKDFVLPANALTDTLVVESDTNDCRYEFSDQGSLFVSCLSAVELLDIGYEVITTTKAIELAADYPTDAKITVLLGDKVIAYERDDRKLLLQTPENRDGEYVIHVAYASQN